MQERYIGKVVLVTGAGTGIGRAVAVRYAKEGARVLIVGRTEASLKETAAQDEKIAYLVADLESDAGINAIMAKLEHDYGQLDILVNNAGWAPVTPISEATIDEYDKVFGINVRALVHLTMKTLPLIKAARGNILNMSSTIVRTPLANMSLYAGTKAAVETLTQVWAKELAADGVRVNAIGVGPIMTPIYDKTALSNQGVEEHIAHVKAQIPMGHFGVPEDVAAVSAFITSEEANFVTGSTYGVDGGLGV